MIALIANRLILSRSSMLCPAGKTKGARFTTRPPSAGNERRDESAGKHGVLIPPMRRFLGGVVDAPAFRISERATPPPSLHPPLPTNKRMADECDKSEHLANNY
jgi:hypothetical protein